MQPERTSPPQNIPDGYLGKNGELFPGLKESFEKIDKTPTGFGHLCSGRLGTIPLDVANGALSIKEAVVLVNEFNKITELDVKIDERTGRLNYGFVDPEAVTPEDVKRILNANTSK